VAVVVQVEIKAASTLILNFKLNGRWGGGPGGLLAGGGGTYYRGASFGSAERPEAEGGAGGVGGKWPGGSIGE
jgi:hypothetical protein